MSSEDRRSQAQDRGSGPDDPGGPNALDDLFDDPGLKRRYLVQRVGKALTASSLVFAAAFLAFLVLSVLEQGVGAIDLAFLTNPPSSIPERAGIGPVIVGSVYLMLVAMAFTVPVGVAAAVYLEEFAPDTRATELLQRFIENLAGVPSIVFGLLGLALFVRFFEFDKSVLSGGLTLGLLVLPIVVVASQEALDAVPDDFRDAALAMGATRWQATRDHVLPAAVPGIMTGTILALSRAIGETAPILFLGAVFARNPPSGIFDGFLALPLQIFFWTRHPSAEFHELAAGAILVLLLVLLLMNSAAVVVRQWATARRQW